MIANKNILKVNVNLVMMCFFTTLKVQVFLKSKHSFLEVICVVN